MKTAGQLSSRNSRLCLQSRRNRVLSSVHSDFEVEEISDPFDVSQNVIEYDHVFIE